MTTIQVKRGATAAVSAYTPASGELVLDTTTKILYVGDGTTVGGIQVTASASSANVTALSGLTGAANLIPYFTGAGAMSTFTCPAAARTVLTAGTTAALMLAAMSGAPLASPTLTGVPAAPTASTGTNTTQLATTAFVIAQIASSLSAATIDGGTL